MREQFDGPKASSDRPWSVPSLLHGLGHRGRSDFQCSIDTNRDSTRSGYERRLLMVDTHRAVPEPIADSFPHTPGSF